MSANTGDTDRKTKLTLTSRLPVIDKVELQKVEAKELWIGKILATKTLEGAEAKTVARIWRSQTFGGSGYACHYPAYAIKFYSKGKQIGYASLCWECKNIGFIEPEVDSFISFNATGKQGQKLLAVFTKAFP